MPALDRRYNCFESEQRSKRTWRLANSREYSLIDAPRMRVVASSNITPHGVDTVESGRGRGETEGR